MSLRYQIVLHKSDEGYAVNCPALPGCGSQGETEQEAMQNIVMSDGSHFITIPVHPTTSPHVVFIEVRRAQ